ncbi:hypothetical protein D9M69_666490 [compost metagenome]
MKDEITGAAQDRRTAHIARLARVVHAYHRAAVGVPDSVTGRNETRHVFLQVLVSARQCAADRIDDDQDRALSRAGDACQRAQEPLDVLVAHEVDRLFDHIKAFR